MLCENKFLRSATDLNLKTKKLAWITLFMIFLSVGFIFLVKNVDIAPVGPFERIVGLSSINKFFLELFGFNILWYRVTNMPGMIIDLLVVFVFFVTGLKQLIQRKSILKVDRNILILGAVYVASFLTYILFEKFAINYRPVILPGEKILEPSFPSSHTMFAIVVTGTAIMECQRLIKNKKVRRIIDCLLCLVGLVVIVGRMISGVHWFTDIIGGILLGCTLLVVYALMVDVFDNKFDNRIKRF